MTRARAQERLFTARTASTYRHMAERAGKDLKFTLEDLRKKMRLAVGSACLFCGQKVTVKLFSLDHATPVSRGGTLALRNLAVICAPCNRAKGNMTREEFARFLVHLRTYPEEVRTSVLARLKAGGAVFLKR
jgi:5-methylcytosine-specific restriction endonuclease McrA